MEDTKSTKMRASVSRNSTGYSVDCAVEMVNGTHDDWRILIARLRSFMAQLERFYPDEHSLAKAKLESEIKEIELRILERIYPREG